MDKELCFNIENINLYLEQTLVDYLDIPIFFLCSGEKQYYAALCTNIDELGYIVVKLSLMDVYNLLHGSIPMRDVILNQNEYWDIVLGEEITSDTVIKKNISKIETALLPEAGVCFKVLTEQMQLFVKKFDEEIFNNKYFSESNNEEDINELIKNLPMDVIFKDIEDIEQFTELLDYIVEKTQFANVPLYVYGEKMDSIKTVEVTFRNTEKSEQVKTFKLGDNIVVAA